MSQKQETAIEVKVGALVLFSLALLAAFIIVLGDISFDDGYTIYVDFDNAQGLKPGADVAISGIKAGRVSTLQFMGGNYDEEVKRRVQVRAHVVIEPDMAYAVRKTSKFYITTQGVLGEKYIEVVTPDPGAEEIKEGIKLQGEELPRLDELLAKGSQLLDGLADALSSGEVPISKLVKDLDNFIVHTDDLIVGNRDKIDRIITNVETMSTDGVETVEGLRDGIGDGEDIAATLANARALTARLNRDAGPLLQKSMSTLDRVESAVGTVDDIVTRKQPQIEGTIDNVYAASKDINATTTDVRTVVADIRAGKGSIGALLTDEEIYDDLKELMRELKRRPWKIIWKE